MHQALSSQHPHQPRGLSDLAVPQELEAMLRYKGLVLLMTARFGLDPLWLTGYASVRVGESWVVRKAGLNVWRAPVWWV